MSQPAGRLSALIPPVLAGVSLAWVAGLLLVLVARPIATEDFWWHLELGETYATQGLFPAQDPLLHPTTRAPVPHEWLFSASAYEVVKLAGLHGWRVVHTLLVAAIVGLAFVLARRASGSKLAAALAATGFMVVSLPRLMQARPDLPTILSALAIYGLLWGSERPLTAARVAAATGVLVLWANMHSVFALELVLLAAAACGAWFEAAAARGLGAGDGATALGRAKWLGVALGVGLVATLLNPRGYHHHLTFFAFSGDSALFTIEDEWTPFNPFWPRYPYNNPQVQLLAWAVTDALLVFFPLVFVRQYLRFRRAPSPEALRALAPGLFLPAAAALASIFISARFLWLMLLPALYVLTVLRETRAFERPATAWRAAVASVVVAAFAWHGSGWRAYVSDTPRNVRDYLAQGWNERRYPDPGVRFLSGAGLEGNLFNHYTLGGYLGYRLAPSLRTFVDGRTEHYTRELHEAYRQVIEGPPEARLAALDRYGVDVFFAFGGAASKYPSRQDTLRALRGVPGWKLVFRSSDHAVYLRDGPRNAKNLERVTAYYQRAGVPFDPEGGFEVAQVLRVAPTWAVLNRLVPPDYGGLLARAQDPAAPGHAEALRSLAFAWRVLDDEADLARLPLR